jgi:Arc/MetJ family transcription regulator
MRTTVELDDDVARAVEELRREGRGVSAAVNELIRRGLVAPATDRAFVQRTKKMGIRIDVSNIAEVLDLIEGPDAR